MPRGLGLVQNWERPERSQWIWRRLLSLFLRKVWSLPIIITFNLMILLKRNLKRLADMSFVQMMALPTEDLQNLRNQVLEGPSITTVKRLTPGKLQWLQKIKQGPWDSSLWFPKVAAQREQLNQIEIGHFLTHDKAQKYLKGFFKLFDRERKEQGKVSLQPTFKKLVSQLMKVEQSQRLSRVQVRQLQVRRAQRVIASGVSPNRKLNKQQQKYKIYVNDNIKYIKLREWQRDLTYRQVFSFTLIYKALLDNQQLEGSALIEFWSEKKSSEGGLQINYEQGLIAEVNNWLSGNELVRSCLRLQ